MGSGQLSIHLYIHLYIYCLPHKLKYVVMQMTQWEYGTLRWISTVAFLSTHVNVRKN